MVKRAMFIPIFFVCFIDSSCAFFKLPVVQGLETCAQAVQARVQAAQKDGTIMAIQGTCLRLPTTDLVV
jgi:hypothetical protein